MSLLFIAYKLVLVFRINRSVDILMQSLEKALPLVGAFLIFIAIVLTGMSIIAMNIWGPYMVEFKTFSDAFMSVLFI